MMAITMNNPNLLLATGLEDVLYFVFSKQPMTACMSWFNELGAPVSWSSNVLNECCVSPFALLSFSAIGIFVSYKVFNKLKKDY